MTKLEKIGKNGIPIFLLLVLYNPQVCVSDILEEKLKEFVKQQQKKHGVEKVKFIVCDVSKEEDYESEYIQLAIIYFSETDNFIIFKRNFLNILYHCMENFCMTHK